MPPAIFRGVVREGVIRLEHAMILAEGTEVVVSPTIRSEADGTSAALLAAAREAPSVPSEWVDELEMLIDQGLRPATQEDPFMNESDSRERG